MYFDATIHCISTFFLKMTSYTRHETHAYHTLLHSRGTCNLVDSRRTGKFEMVNVHYTWLVVVTI